MPGKDGINKELFSCSILAGVRAGGTGSFADPLTSRFFTCRPRQNFHSNIYLLSKIFNVVSKMVNFKCAKSIMYCIPG